MFIVMGPGGATEERVQGRKAPRQTPGVGGDSITFVTVRAGGGSRSQTPLRVGTDTEVGLKEDTTAHRRAVLDDTVGEGYGPSKSLEMATRMARASGKERRWRVWRCWGMRLMAYLVSS